MKRIVVILSVLIWILIALAWFLLDKKCDLIAKLKLKTSQVNQVQKIETKTATETDRKIKLGAYTLDNIADKEDFEEKIESRLDLVSTFVLWGDEDFPSELATNVAGSGQTLVVYWETRDSKTRNLNDEKYSYDAILNGEWDDYINSIGQTVKDIGGNTILVPFLEMNGNWYPWSITKNNNNPEKHKQAFQKIHNMLNKVPNISLAWVVNNGSVPKVEVNNIDNLYPGDEYVDYVGVDGFNFGNPWQEFDEVFAESLAKLKSFDKPIFIFSTASSDGPMKSEWIEKFGQKLLEHPEIKGFIWFNQDKERDWRVWSDPESLMAFKNLVEITK